MYNNKKLLVMVCLIILICIGVVYGIYNELCDPTKEDLHEHFIVFNNEVYISGHEDYEFKYAWTPIGEVNKTRHKAQTGTSEDIANNECINTYIQLYEGDDNNLFILEPWLLFTDELYHKESDPLPDYISEDYPIEKIVLSENVEITAVEDVECFLEPIRLSVKNGQKQEAEDSKNIRLHNDNEVATSSVAIYFKNYPAYFNDIFLVYRDDRWNYEIYDDGMKSIPANEEANNLITRLLVDEMN